MRGNDLSPVIRLPRGNWVADHIFATKPIDSLWGLVFRVEVNGVNPARHIETNIRMRCFSKSTVIARRYLWQKQQSQRSSALCAYTASKLHLGRTLEFSDFRRRFTDVMRKTLFRVNAPRTMRPPRNLQLGAVFRDYETFAEEFNAFAGLPPIT